MERIRNVVGTMASDTSFVGGKSESNPRGITCHDRELAYGAGMR
eukprot:CAMPEP_0171313770 /NCGR_PEP_ID=MMETSP0816-20121228/45300_1 /TAXON_ID=420281 /ORGANISM="Proboscia inermis, Strain CCAP1064/1" /LENGTH=43 /DNA_ID= /DNA_START= /DNA_END= /DNA_ORIENTATION=